MMGELDPFHRIFYCPIRLVGWKARVNSRTWDHQQQTTFVELPIKEESNRALWLWGIDWATIQTAGEMVWHHKYNKASSQERSDDGERPLTWALSCSFKLFCGFRRVWIWVRWNNGFGSRGKGLRNWRYFGFILWWIMIIWLYWKFN